MTNPENEPGARCVLFQLIVQKDSTMKW